MNYALASEILPYIPDDSLRSYIETLMNSATSSSATDEKIGRLAMAYDANGFDQAAENVYRLAAERSSKPFKWQYLLALRLKKNGDLKGAIDIAEIALQSNSTYPATYVRLGNWLLDYGEPETALIAFERAVELGAGPAAELGTARAFLKLEDFESALGILNSVASRFDHPTTFRLLSDTWRAMGETVKSREFLQYASDTKSMWFDDPVLSEMLSHAKGKNNRIQDVELMLGSGLVNEALDSLHRLEAEGLVDFNVQYRFALAHFHNQSFELAMQRLVKAIELEPTHYPSHLLLASLYQRAENNYKAALHLEHVLTIYPTLQIAHQELGFVRLRLGDTEGALLSFESAISLDSTAPNVHYYAGVIKGAQGACDRAVKDFETALALDNAHEKARVGLTECLYALSESSTETERSSNEKQQPNDGSFD